MFIIQVNKSEVKILLTEKLYSFAKNIYKLHVVWSNDWCGLTKLAHFYVGKTRYDIDMTNLDEVCIPWELFANRCSVGKNLTVSFEGTWKDHIIIPTPVTNLGVIRRSDTENADAYVPPAPPTPNLYQQLRDELDTKADDASFDKETRMFRLWANKKAISEFEIPGGGGGSGESGADGKDGESAYEIAVKNGFEGTEEEWLESLKGEPGAPGPAGRDGKSAYAIALQEGFDGSEAEWLESLKGAPGPAGEKGDKGDPGQDGQNGSDGFSPTVSIEEIDGGHKVTITDENGEQSFDVLDGVDATATEIADGTLFIAKFDGAPQVSNQVHVLPMANVIGKRPGFRSTYAALIGDSKELYLCQVIVSHFNGANNSVGIEITSVSPLTVDAYSKTEIDQMLADIGSGTDGESAYDIAVRHGFTGTEEEWLASLKGPPGDAGSEDHRQLSHRDAEDQHPIGAISGLEKELERIPEPVEALTNSELEEMLK